MLHGFLNHRVPFLNGKLQAIKGVFQNIGKPARETVNKMKDWHPGECVDCVPVFSVLRNF
jgi:hypothetical protein